MLAFFKRDFISFFKSPVGYVAFALFAFLSGFLFASNFATGAISISTEIMSLRTFFVILVPIVTMGLFSEDKKRGTDIIYYTSPSSLFSVVFGKFLASFCLFAVLFINVLVHIIVTKAYSGVIDYGVWGSVILYFILSALFISIGLLASAITDNQIVSAIVSFVMIMLIQLLPTIGSFVANIVISFLGVFSTISTSTALSIEKNITNAFSWFDPITRTDCFRYGVFSPVAIIFCITFTAFFLFLTYRILEKKRWSQS